MLLVPIPVWLPFDDHGEHCQIAIAGVDDAVLGALLADVARACAQELLFPVANRFAGSRQDVVDVIACLMRVQANRAACMNGRRDDFALLIHMHPGAHLARPVIHPRDGNFLDFVEIYQHRYALFRLRSTLL